MFAQDVWSATCSRKGIVSVLYNGTIYRSDLGKLNREPQRYRILRGIQSTALTISQSNSVRGFL